MKQDKTGIKYFTQIGTGNYNASTSSLYTDISLITSNEDIGKDAVDFSRIWVLIISMENIKIY